MAVKLEKKLLMQTEHERFLAEEHFRRPVIVYDYPKEIKAFYMRGNDEDVYKRQAPGQGRLPAQVPPGHQPAGLQQLLRHAGPVPGLAQHHQAEDLRRRQQIGRAHV